MSFGLNPTSSREVRLDSPRGALGVTIMRGIGAGMFPRFDSACLEDYVDHMFAVSLPHLRNDAAATAAFARELEYVFKEVLLAQYAPLRAADFIPVNTEVPPGSLTCTFRMLQGHGSAQIVNNFAADLPSATLDGREWQSPIVTVGSSYFFTVVQMMSAALANTPFESILANTCRFGIEYLGEQIACVGSAEDGISGITNAAGITATTQVSSGTWLSQIASIAAATSSTPSTAAAVAQALAMDLLAMKKQVFIATRGMYPMDTILFPTDIWAALDGVPRSPVFTGDTILSYLKSLTQCELDFWPQLDTAATSGRGRVMGYRKDPEVLRQIWPMPFTQLPPQAKNLAWQVPALAQYGGVNVMRPGAVTYLDGLD